MAPRKNALHSGTRFRNHGVATKLNVEGQRIPIHVKRPILEVTREAGTNVQLREEPGGTTRLVVDAGAGGRRIQEHEPVQPRETGWTELPENMPKDAAGWKNVSGEEIKKYTDFWGKISWNEKWDKPDYVRFEAERAGRQRAKIAERIAQERTAVHKNAIAAAEAELKKPWGQRKRNAGLANKLWWRPFYLAQDIVALPFAVGSWLLGKIARPVSWINDKILKSPSYIADKNKKGIKRTKLYSGTTKKDFLPSIRTERRELAGWQKKKAA